MKEIRLSKKQINILWYMRKEEEVCTEDVNANTLKSLIKRKLIKEARPFWYILTDLGKSIDIS